MALKSTIFKVGLQVAHIERGHYADYPLTIARHPSETDERMMVRLLAFALHAGPDLRFGRGVSTEDEPALWEIDGAGDIQLWIDVGLPDEARLRKACHRAGRVVVLAYGARAVDVWWSQNSAALGRLANLAVWQLRGDEAQALAGLAERNMKLSCTIQDESVYLDRLELHPLRLQ